MVLTKTKETLEELASSAQFSDGSEIFVRAGGSPVKGFVRSFANLFLGKDHLYFSEIKNSERMVFAFNELWNISGAAVYRIVESKILHADGYETFVDLSREKPLASGQEAIDFMRKKAE